MALRDDVAGAAGDAFRAWVDTRSRDDPWQHIADAIIPLVRAAERERDALAAENARLRAALRESIGDNMWNAYHIGIVKDGKWMDGGMSDAEGLRRELGLADGWHDAEAIQDAIPAAAANAVARVVRS